MSLLDDAIDQAERTLELLKAARDHATDRLTLAAAPEAATAATDATDTTDTAAGEGGSPDNELPFKCPGCGATYELQVECTNGHPAEQTLPTQDVLAGAAPADPTAEQPAVDDANAVVETGTTPPPAQPVPAAETGATGGGDGAGPTWPAGTA